MEKVEEKQVSPKVKQVVAHIDNMIEATRKELKDNGCEAIVIRRKGYDNFQVYYTCKNKKEVRLFASPHIMDTLEFIRLYAKGIVQLANKTDEKCFLGDANFMLELFEKYYEHIKHKFSCREGTIALSKGTIIIQ